MNTRLTSPHALVVALATAGVIGAVGAGAYTSARAVNAPTNTASVAPAAMVTLPDFSTITSRDGPAVVNISVTGTAKASDAEAAAEMQGIDPDDPMLQFFRRFQGQMGPRAQQREVPVRAQGSGFIVSPDGIIMTNAHVVKDAKEVTVKLTDRREFRAKVLGADAKTDIAVLKIDAKNLPTLALGNTKDLKVGEWVLAIGSPFGFESTVTAGVVSAKGRSLPDDSYVPFIQTDVAVNPGNSGGPLLNMRGEVIGINSQIFSRTGSFAGISFAIPIDYAFNVADQLIKTGKVVRGRIGVGIQNVTKDLADSLGLAKAQGAVVGNVEEGSPAAKGGLEVGDVILKIDGRNVEGSADLSRTIRALKPGTKINLNVWRSGKPRDVAVTVAEFKDEEATKTAAAGKSKKPEAKPGKLGVAVIEMTAEQKKALKISNGVIVEAADGAALAAGIGPGDVILRVNNVDITNVKSFTDTVAKLDPKKAVAVLIRDEQGTRFVTFRPEPE